MNKPDARHLTIETQNYLRQQAIRLREQGKPVKAISEYLGVHRNMVWDGWWEYQHDGETALSQQHRRADLLKEGKKQWDVVGNLADGLSD